MMKFLAGLVGLLFCWSAAAAPRLFDVHMHYKWDQAEVTTPAEAVDILRANNIQKAVVIGTPPELVLKLYDAAPDRVIPFFGPYRVGGEKLSWQFRSSLLDEAREALASGRYKGIGELHLIGGNANNWRRSKVFAGLLTLAVEHDVPVMLHTEYWSIKPTVEICKEHPRVRFLLAHAGAVLAPAKVARVLQACPNVWMDLAARDPWRYINHPITGENGRLTPDWSNLVQQFSDRFMIGSDTVWPVDQATSWDIADTGWQETGRFIEFHRRWLSYLTDEVEEKLRWGNAARFFRIAAGNATEN